MTDHEWKAYGTVVCDLCGRTHRQFMRESVRETLVPAATIATCVCGWRLKEWPEGSRREYSFKLLEDGTKTQRMTNKKRPRDVNQLAKAVVDLATGEVEDKVPIQSARKGGLKGGRARAKALTPEQRAAIARTAAEARWKKGS